MAIPIMALPPPYYAPTLEVMSIAHAILDGRARIDIDFNHSAPRIIRIVVNGYVVDPKLIKRHEGLRTIIEQYLAKEIKRWRLENQGASTTSSRSRSLPDPKQYRDQLKTLIKAIPSPPNPSLLSRPNQYKFDHLNMLRLTSPSRPPPVEVKRQWSRPVKVGDEILNGVFIGWRTWLVHRRKPDVLVSRSNDRSGTVWSPGEPLKAVDKGHFYPVDTPGPGIYARKNAVGPDTMTWLMQKAVWKRVVVGEVALWGEVTEHEYGYRAQYAYPISLIDYPGVEWDCVVPTPTRNTTTVQNIAEVYGLEVLDWHDFTTYENRERAEEYKHFPLPIHWEL